MRIKIFWWYLSGKLTRLLQNDLRAAWDAISKLKSARIDIILDNAGFELYADLIFTSYLLTSGIAETVILRPKLIPWYDQSQSPTSKTSSTKPVSIRFVSDVTPPDIGHLFSSLSNPAYFDVSGSRSPALDFLIDQLTAFYADGRVIIRPHNFWTTPHSFWRLPAKAPDLLADLEDSDLLIFKGDLNYRKCASPRRFGFCTC